MGTNYYLRRIPTKEEIAQCHKLVDEQKFEYIDVMNDKYGAGHRDRNLSHSNSKGISGDTFPVFGYY